MKRHPVSDELPSIPVPGPARLVHRIIGPPRIGQSIQVRRVADPDGAAEQQAREQQMRQEEMFWNLRYRNRP
jgi:hypothetical protein